MLHQSKHFHEQTRIAAENVISNFGSETNILDKLDSARQQQVKANREVLVSIIDTLVIHGRQGIPLRGNDDAGNLTLDKPDENDGNCRTPLRMCMRCGLQSSNRT